MLLLHWHPTTVQKRQILEIRGGELAEQADQAELGLIKAEAGVYVRGSMLVRVTSQPAAQGADRVNRLQGSPVITELKRVALADMLNRTM